MGRDPLQIQWLARTLRYWNKLAGLSPRSLLGGTFVANVAAGLGCGRTNVWAAELRAALQFACPDPGWTAHMMQGKPIDVAPTVVAAARQASVLYCAAPTQARLMMTVAPIAISASMPLHGAGRH
jgi:hypothetical protein